MAATHIDRYVLKGLLGEGNMGSVYLAYDPKFNREVAVKTIRDDMLGDERVRKWFHREARAMAQLQHPGIVEVHDYSGADTEEPYLVMERLHGHTLQDVVKKRGVFPDGAVCEVAVQLGQALMHAHSQGLIHRDLKPENIFVEPDGRLVITDFGLARAQLSVDLGASLASAGTAVVGTPLFLAPETIHDPKAASPQSDLYAVGIVLYVIATSEVPFSGADAFQALSRILSGQHKLVSELRKDMPGLLADAIERSFAMSLDVRPKNGETLELLFASVRERICAGLDSLQILREFLNQTEEFSAFTVATAMSAPDGPIGSGARVFELEASHTQITSGQTQISAVEHTQTRVVTAAVGPPKKSRVPLLVGLSAVVLSLVAAAALVVRPNDRPRGPAQIAPAITLTPAAALTPPDALPPPTDIETPKALPTEPVALPLPTPASVLARKPPSEKAVEKLAEPGTLRVNTGSVWADVYVNGEKKGQTPFKPSVELPPGKYSVRLVNPEYGVYEQVVTISSGATTPLKTTLNKK